MNDNGVFNEYVLNTISYIENNKLRPESQTMQEYVTKNFGINANKIDTFLWNLVNK